MPDYTAPPSLFENTVDIAIRGEGSTPGTGDIIGETAAWSAAYAGNGFECRHGHGVIDPGRKGFGNTNRSGRAYFVQNIRPQIAGVNWQYGIRFMSYNLKTKVEEHHSYPIVIVSQSSSTTDWRAPGIAVNPDDGTVWVMYGSFTGSDDDNKWDVVRNLHLKSSSDNGVTWSSEQTLRTLTTTEFVGTRYQPMQISFGPNGNGLLLYVEFDAGSSGMASYVREFTSSWGAEDLVDPSIGGYNNDTEGAGHAVAAGTSEALVVVPYDASPSFLYRVYRHTWGSTAQTLIDLFDFSTNKMQQPIFKYSESDGYYHLCFAKSNGGVFLRAYSTTAFIGSVTVSNDSDIDAIDMAGGDALAMEIDIDGNIFVIATNGGANCRSGYIKYSFDGSTYTKVHSDVMSWFSTSAAYYFETNQDPFLGSSVYGANAIYTYDKDLHFLINAYHGTVAGGDDNFYNIWEIVAANVTAAEPTTPDVNPTGDGSYLWMQSKYDSVDSIIASAGANPSDSLFSTDAQLHPIYAGEFSRQKSWQRFWMRYTNWGEADLTLTWWTDNRVGETKTFTMNVADFVTMFSSGAELGEFLMPPEDFVVQHPVDTQTGGVKLHLRIQTTRGRYSFRGIDFELELGDRQAASPRILQKKYAHSSAWRQG